MNLWERNAKKVAIGGVFAASTSAIFIRMIAASPLAVGFYRLAFSVPFFIVAVCLWHKKEIAGISRKYFLHCMFTGLLLTIHFLSWFTAVNHTTVASAVVIGSTHPIIILVVTTLVYRERTSWKAALGVIIALVGSAIVTAGDYSFSGQAAYGDLMAFVASAFFALYFLAGRKIRQTMNATVYVSLVFGSSGLFFALGMWITGTPFRGYTTMDYVYLLGVALVCQMGGHAIFNWCLGHVSPLYLSTVDTAEVIFATILAALIFKEIPAFWQVVGGVVTVMGLLYYHYHDGKMTGNREV